MITLFTSGRRWGIPDASPFVSKAEILLKMANVDYQTGEADFRKTPKGKIPYIDTGDGTLLGDSTFIRFHLEDRYAVDFDKGLSAADKATALAFERMCEENIYWAIVYSRWMVKANFDKGPRTFFDRVPAVLRPLVLVMVNRKVRSNLQGHGLGRHTREEIERLAKRELSAISAFLGNKAFLMGAEPCGADAAVWSMVAGVLCGRFDTPIRTHAEGLSNLVAYRDRGMKRWFPELV